MEARAAKAAVGRAYFAAGAGLHLLPLPTVRAELLMAPLLRCLCCPTLLRQLGSGKPYSGRQRMVRGFRSAVVAVRLWRNGFFEWFVGVIDDNDLMRRLTMLRFVSELLFFSRQKLLEFLGIFPVYVSLPNKIIVVLNFRVK